MENKNQEPAINSSYSDGEIDLKILTRLFKRNWIFISTFIILGSTIGLFRSYSKVSVWKGTFEIVVDGDKKNAALGPFSGANDTLQNIMVPNLLSKSISDNKTQEEILNSPYVLKPVFNYVKNEYKNRGENIDKLTFKDWSQKKLSTEFKQNTNVLKVSFKDKDKKFILNTLNLVSRRYQIYSKNTKQKGLKKALNYLLAEKDILTARTQKSLREFNEFSIKNGLSDIDGFAGLKDKDSTPIIGSGLNQLSVGGDYSNLNASVTQGDSEAALRFSRQFSLLEEYETLLLSLSSKIKPDSQIIVDLNSKIDNLRESLKRPSEILIEYRNLKRLARRNESLLSNIEDNISVLSIQIKQQPDPYLTISDAFIDDARVSPNRKTDLAKAFLFSTFIAFLIAYFRERKLNKIYEFDTFKEKIKFNYLDNINYDDTYINTLFIKNISKDGLKSKIGVIDISDNFLNYEKKSISQKTIFNEDKDLLEIKDYKSDNIQKCNSIILIVEPGKVSLKNLDLINKYLYSYSNKIIGWIFVN
tara:strand:- start:1670 stop:3259 length:1590 start_codon:yes stop_codon:yes gene_type:complete